MTVTGGIALRKIHGPSRPFRLGTRRRRPGREAGSQAGAVAAGASRPRMRPNSLDTDKQLATSDAEWLRWTLTGADLYRQQQGLHRELLGTYARIFEKYASAQQNDPALAEWWSAYQLASRPLNQDETPTARHLRVEKWLNEHKPDGANARAIKWEKKWTRLQHCQMEWIGYSAECCGDRTSAIAVPIGCNDRLCPLCAWHRSQRARVKIKTLFDRLKHPVLVTFTIPNLTSIRKKHIQRFRKMVRAWFAQNQRIDGGVYSIECTYNRQQKTWHLHAHALCNFESALPTKETKVDFFGQRVFAFTRAKWEWEFDWLNLCKDAWAKAPKVKRPAKGAERWRLAWEHYGEAFRQWTLAKREHSTLWAKRKNPRTGKFELRDNLTAGEQRRYKQLERWNAQNTRLIDVRPVTDRDRAVYEVLKYLTKGAKFSDVPEAVEEFSAAVAGARMVQTFGSFYGLDIEASFDPEHMDDWSQHKCNCGLNIWKRIGVLFRRDVEMDTSGKWHLRREVQHNNRGGTVPRPTIRALEWAQEREG